MPTSTPKLGLQKPLGPDILRDYLKGVIGGGGLHATFDILDEAVLLTATQTLTNKTLTNPVLVSPAYSGSASTGQTYDTAGVVELFVYGATGSAVRLRDRSAAADNEIWSIDTAGGSGTLSINANNDALSVGTSALQITRSGTTVTGITLLTSNGDIVVTPASGRFRPSSDGGNDCGGPSNRWSSVWATNGTIQTSSRATKHVLGCLDPAEAMAALRGLAIYRYHYLRPDGTPDTEYTHTGPVAEEMPAVLMVKPGHVNGQDTAGYALAALLDLDARLTALEAR